MANITNIKFQILNKLFNPILHLYSSYETLGRRLLLFEYYEEYLCPSSTIRFNKEKTNLEPGEAQDIIKRSALELVIMKKQIYQI